MARTRVYAAGSNPHTQSPDRHIYKSHALRLAPPPGILHGSCTAVARQLHAARTKSARLKCAATVRSRGLLTANHAGSPCQGAFRAANASVAMSPSFLPVMRIVLQIYFSFQL